ncbi:hypothetical protein EYF80_003818 [Liparis tanakae]|uniref:Uncharacterized protein n=1 Tax=Liparis tanakae TaxID=230148 RepID=A0A4Z2J7T8_9TELE|nr:hypothetical protein EYF80_003818 [Liparis tanakae]
MLRSVSTLSATLSGPPAITTYGVKRKRDRSTAGKLAAKRSEASYSAEVTQLAKKQHAASVCTQVAAAIPMNIKLTSEDEGSDEDLEDLEGLSRVFLEPSSSNTVGCQIIDDSL